MSRQASGLRAWVFQRVTAIYLGLFVLYVVLHFLINAPGSYAAWRGWIGSPLIAVLWALAVLALLMHVWVGIRDVFIDYVHPIAIRVFLLALLGFGLVGCGIWAARVLFLVVNS